MFEHLHVLHLRKDSRQPDQAQLLNQQLPQDFFFIETCQRYLWLAHKRSALSVTLKNQTEFSDIFEGIDAYEFLLSVGCGLESQVIGETEIFGQIKTAWKSFSQNGHRETYAFLSPIFQKYFEDIKEIRSRYLRSTGYASYGSLLRKSLTDQKAKGSILVVGAGELAESVLPWLSKFQVTLTNRTKEKADALALSLKQKGCETEVQAFQQSWDRFDHIILLIPAQESLKIKLESWMEQKNTQKILCDLAEPSWIEQNEVPGISITRLQNFYEQKKIIDAKTALEVEKARKACHEKAVIREMQNVITLTHGWEDLWSAV